MLTTRISTRAMGLEGRFVTYCLTKLEKVFLSRPLSKQRGRPRIRSRRDSRPGHQSGEYKRSYRR